MISFENERGFKMKATIELNKSDLEAALKIYAKSELSIDVESVTFNVSLMSMNPTSLHETYELNSATLTYKLSADKKNYPKGGWQDDR